MDDLRELQAALNTQPPTLPPQLCAVTTPMNLAAWRANLRPHPDGQFTKYILTGLANGYRIGFDRSVPLRSSKNNMTSTLAHPEVVDSYLSEEARTGRVLKIERAWVGMLAPHISPFGVIPKRGQPGKWRLILDLSSPQGFSVNAGIASALCSIKYSSVDDAVRHICRLGRGAQLAKLDLRSAYRMVPVHPDDRLLLGMSWQDDIYIDAALPFGLRSAPKIFSALADALLWIMLSKGVGPTLHYLDDFLSLGPPAPST